MGLTNNAMRLRAESPNWRSFFWGGNKSKPTKRWPEIRMYSFNIFNIQQYQFSGQKVFLSTAGYFRDKKIVKHEAEMLKKIRTF